MSKQDGPIVFTVTSERQMPKVFKTGATYVAQKASAVAIESVASSQTKGRTTRSSAKTSDATGRKKTTKKSSTAGRKKKNKTTKTKSTKSNSKRIAKSSSSARATKVSKKPKSTKRKPVKPEVIVHYVQNNDGCNMTDIEGAVKLPQAIIRRILNTARDSGSIRTEGQRRGLRYFGNQKSTSDQAEAVSASAGNDSESGW